MNRTEYLMHHGIKGQKWGQRNGPPYPLSRQSRFGGTEKNKKGTSGSGTGQISERKKRKQKIAAIKKERQEAVNRRYEMSDEELDKRLNRMRKESELVKLTNQSSSSKVKEFFKKIRDRAINRAVDRAVDKTVDKTIDLGKETVEKILEWSAEDKAGGNKNKVSRRQFKKEQNEIEKAQREKLMKERGADDLYKKAIEYGKKHNLDLDDGGGGSPEAGRKYMEMFDKYELIEDEVYRDAKEYAAQYMKNKYSKK